MYYGVMYSRLLKPPEKKSFFLFGPRGTGKSTWVQKQYPDALYLDLLEAEIYTDLLANPQRLENFIPQGFDDWIIIDEIQKVPTLLDEVHRLIEKKRHRFILTGSSARKLRRKGVNLLAGRALTYNLYPLTTSELGRDFNLERSLQFGHLPAIPNEPDPKKYLESYVQTYLKEEVQAEGLTRNLGTFARFMEAASFSQGSVLNISEVARECTTERKVVESYFTILEDLLIGVRLPVFAKRAKRRTVAHPKFYFFDVGVFRTIRPTGPLDRPEEIEGVAFETLLFQELRAINDYYNLGYELFYWRTSNGAEVDFILYGKQGLIAIEIKRTAKTQKKDFSGLRSFLRDYPQAKAYLVYGGSRRMSEGKIDVIPLSICLKELPTLLTKTN